MPNIFWQEHLWKHFLQKRKMKAKLKNSYAIMWHEYIEYKIVGISSKIIKSVFVYGLGLESNMDQWKPWFC